MKFFNRDLSWLTFNYRVLEEARDKSLPIYERIKFLAIFSSNLDEFYKVRISNYKNLISLSRKNQKKLKFSPNEILKKIKKIVIEQQKEFGEIFRNDILTELEKNKIILLNNKSDINDFHKKFIIQFFSLEVLPYIQAVLLDKNNILQFLQDKSIYIVVKLFKKLKKNQKKIKKIFYASIKIPSDNIPRFIKLPKKDNNFYIIFLDDIIKLNLNILFPGFNILEFYSIKLSRDADFSLEEEYKGNLLEKIKKAVAKRKVGLPCRFLYDEKMPEFFLKELKLVFRISDTDLIEGGTYHNFSDLFYFPNPLSPKLELENLKQIRHYELDKFSSIFKAIKKNEYLLHFPYHSYEYVIRFFNEGAIDPKVTEIKTTQYRVAKNSAVVSALISAAKNGKKVAVFVEIKARFDEKNNLFFLEKMKKAGIKIIPSLPFIKVHSKMAIINRGRKEKYAFISTGNFNEKTAKLYVDDGFFTKNKKIIFELEKVFEFFENPKLNFKFKHIFVGKFQMREKILKKISNEITNVKNKKDSFIILKMNGLEDEKIIKKLYQASQKGVKIDLLVRGICCLIPNEEFSKNIRIIRIVDRYLEHSRIFIFHNDGKNDTYISSADLMKRNLSKRIEIIVPIYNEKLKNEILQILKIQLSDNTKARILDENLNNCKIKINKNEKKIQSQMKIYNFLQEINI